MSAITDPILLDSTGQDIVEALEAIAENMGTSAGHTIQNDTGTDMQRRDKLQFKGVYVEDNQANDVTKVDIVREFQSKSAIEALTGEEAKGFQYLDDDVYDAFTASEIGFDNSDTSFTGTDVQEVLEEVDSKIDDVSTPVDISSQIVFNETYIDTTDSNTIVNVIKMGKMVVVTISGLALKQALSGSTTFISNLPIPKFDINVGLNNPISGQSYTSRCRLRDTGELKIWFDSIPQNSIPFGQFTYFTN